MTRDEYVQQLKTQLDKWNAEVSVWEAKARAAQADMRAEYEKRLAAFRAQRDRSLDKLHEVQGASAQAWKDMARGADEAWDRLRQAFDRARSAFEKK